MKIVSRHRFERDPREDFAHPEKMLARARELLTTTDDPVNLIERTCARAANLMHLAGAVGDKPRTNRALRVVAEASAALFTLAAHPATPIRAMIEGHAYSLVVPKAHRLAGPTEWRDGFSAACACRHTDALATLTAVGREVLDLSRMSARWCEFFFAWVPALQALARRDPNAGKLLASVLDGVSEMKDEDSRARCATEVLLAMRLQEGDAKRFNDALEQALLAHRAFWTQPPTPDDFTQERSEHPHGFLALGPLGLACLAHDRGLPVEVQSEYMPAWIVKRDW